MKTDLDSWNEDGVLILRKLFDPDRIAQINETIDKLWQDRATLTSNIVIDTYLQTPQTSRQLFKTVDGEARNHPYKINDLFLESDGIREIVLDRVLCRHLSNLLDGAPMAFNSLNFEYGSQQDDHRDTLFMPPRVANKMAVSWIALEDISSGSGPVRYYPGSHKIPPYLFSTGKQKAVPAELDNFNKTMKDELVRRGIEPVTFDAEVGDVLIWHSQLLHGGMPIAEAGLSRKSLVTHYYRRQDYALRFWQIKKLHAQGYYFKRPHLAPNHATG